MSTCDHIFWGLGPYLFVMFFVLVLSFVRYMSDRCNERSR